MPLYNIVKRKSTYPDYVACRDSYLKIVTSGREQLHFEGGALVLRRSELQQYLVAPKSPII